jgi:hypothetical protein
MVTAVIHHGFAGAAKKISDAATERPSPRFPRTRDSDICGSGAPARQGRHACPRATCSRDRYEAPAKAAARGRPRESALAIIAMVVGTKNMNRTAERLFPLLRAERGLR